MKKGRSPGRGAALKYCRGDCLLAEVGGHAFVGRGHGRVSLVPAKGADFPVQFEVLEGVNHADGFINGAAQREVVDELVADDAVLVNQEEAAVGDQFPGLTSTLPSSSISSSPASTP